MAQETSDASTRNDRTTHRLAYRSRKELQVQANPPEAGGKNPRSEKANAGLFASVKAAS